MTHAQRATVEALLRARADVIVDDTNLRTKTVREWAELAARFDATFEVHDFTDVPLEECLRRDADRPEDERVGEDAIRRMHAAVPGRQEPAAAGPVRRRRRSGRGLPAADPELPPVVLVDIDGTVALMSGRSPFDMGPGRRGRPEPGRHRRGPGHARGRARHRLLLRAGRRRAGRRRRRGWTSTSGCRTRRCSCGRRATRARTRSSSGRSSTGRSATAGGWSGFSTTANRWYGCGVHWG